MGSYSARHYFRELLVVRNRSRQLSYLSTLIFYEKNIDYLIVTSDYQLIFDFKENDISIFQFNQLNYLQGTHIGVFSNIFYC